MIQKSLTVVALLVLLASVSSCKNEPVAETSEADRMTVEQKESIKKEIAARIEEISDGANALNFEAAMKPYADDAQFMVVNPDGSVNDYKGMKSNGLELVKQASAIKYITKKEEFKFLSLSLVLCTWTGSYDIQLKSGEHLKYDPYVGTMLFRKTGSEWKVIYAHESAAAPVPVETKK